MNTPEKKEEKKKSNLVFWGILGCTLIILYTTPWGASIRSWNGGLFLSDPGIEEHMNLYDQEKLKSMLDTQLNNLFPILLI